MYPTDIPPGLCCNPSISQEYKFRVSRRIRDEFENGRDYYNLEGKQIALPSEHNDYPDLRYLASHAKRHGFD